MREIVLDTETTGFDPKSGDRLIEVGCIEIVDLLPTGRTFHRYVNPERSIPEDAIKVHGITDEMVKDAPIFAKMADELLEFIGDAPLIAHNASFDRNFIDWELLLAHKPQTGEARWIDTLAIAKSKFPGQPNTLDALCKRYKISLADRTYHGALIDARLLAEVYLELKGGKERTFDLGGGAVAKTGGPVVQGRIEYGARPRPLPSRLTPQEDADHRAFLAKWVKEPVWTRFGVEPAAKEDA
ncbi:DNA polymerase III subunit epsilon [uncultured Brevundimonas sp.]|uniref:DNA polymerase III subunit epsilon n=1 Tax=uncultured Brevundimonas sp. TaxID=213418 RepID=UPI00263261C3|nr:DNA polymerase III subunit epsilon [uncultured Brevundimonas sp.]